MTDGGLDPIPAPGTDGPPTGSFAPSTTPGASAPEPPGTAAPGAPPPASRAVAIRWGVASDVGQHRPVNQDSALAERPLWIVADGMGGHAAGEVASQLALRTFRDALRRDDATLPTAAGIADAVRIANHAVLERSIADASLRGMGTTICGLALTGDAAAPHLTLTNVGDSRGYVFAAGELRQLTRDHSYVEDLVEAGEITPDEARTHPRRHIVTRALGVEPAIAVDVWERPAQIGERYLLCSDGLTNELGDATIASTLARPDSAQKLADELVAMANRAGGRDNITVLVVDIVDANSPGATGPGGITTVPAPIGGWLADTGELVAHAADGSVTAGGRASDAAGGATDAATAAPPAGASTIASAAGAATGAASLGPPTIGEATADLLGTGLAGTGLLGTKQNRGRARRAADRRQGAAANADGRATPARRRAAPTWVAPVRNLVTIAALAALAAIVIGSIQAYGRAGWYVGFRNDAVTLYRGRPDGLLWVKPQAARLYNAHRSDLTPTWRDRIDRRITFTSAEAADRWFALLSANPDAAPGIAPPAALPTTTTSTAPTTTTTAPTTTLDLSTAVPNVPGTTAPAPPPAATDVAPTSSP